MHLQEFSYDLPEELIAQHPLKERDQARLMVVDRRKESITHDVFANAGKYLPSGSLIVFNNSKVIPARLLGKREKTEGRVEIFLLKRLTDGYSYEALIRPLRRLKLEEKIIFNGGKIFARLKDAENKIVRFNRKDIPRYLNQIGHVPLPPYIKRPDEPQDKEYYQTVYARRPGSVASPTAGLHFTRDLIRRLKSEGHRLTQVTLHINYATFSPVKEADITKHKMHEEEYRVTKHAWKEVFKAKENGRKITAVGTTSCRVLETAAAGKLAGTTNIFIYPGYSFQMTDILLTNFHLPLSTLLMLVYAFGGKELMRRAYKEAIARKYRFYSYGDAMLIV